ncbi:indolepyruvate ferredoxin oxidoreductase subunit alpha [Vibrio sp. HA2012]|uniref:indolepyruvate ferredoxin oxidoreductase subunit alpha n=1 Tax=Vibrio sp. HA2012 TaxID=1971595 RepID=UPI000C2C3594|nr:indolepyruvate ferredoxin oxidoreductase subunit alpha [Vibrio sp. HA2012]PJC86820.1 indolepyruvate ferredoxin oxidoreductase subunit alpha [Vibrio sp. HA2012]
MAKLLTGNEAIARGVWEAGVSFTSAYPGTPSTEIVENIATYKGDIVAEWAPNEKVALESAIGASIVGARSFSAMKMVGLNVAADPLFSFVYSGVNGGMVLVSADDPSLHSSQNEQDNRYYAPFAKLPMLEPADSQESLDMAKEAYEISEQFDTPVMIRMTTRVCHSKTLVDTGTRQEEALREYKKLPKFDLIPANSRKLRINLDKRLEKLAEYSEGSRFNFIQWNSKEIGIITSGVGYQYALEVFGQNASYLKLGMTFPLPKNKIREFAAEVKTLYIIEELEPYLEDQIRQMGIACIGKEKLPNMFELNPDIIRRAFLESEAELIDVTNISDFVVPRPPVLCAGCPHRGFFVELGKIAKRKKAIISGDIGCYGLGGSDPLDAKDTCICMGAAPGIAHGAQKVMEKFGESTRLVSTIGDSTFFHSGMNGLTNILYNNSNAITCILDNRITGMTGQQQNPASGMSLQGDVSSELSIEEVCRSLGAKHIRTVNPNDLKETSKALKWAFDLDEPSVIITRWPCLLKQLSDDEVNTYTRNGKVCEVDEDVCDGCGVCLKIGCPAMALNRDLDIVEINPASCVACEVCAQVCPESAIKTLESRK